MTETAKQMKVERHYIAEMSIYKFGAINDLVMEVHERPRSEASHDRFYAHFKHAEVKEGIALSGKFGNGRTEREAIQNYAKEISMQRLVIDAMSPERRELTVPRLV